MGEWISLNGARIRATTDASERERLLALHRQREPVYDAAYLEFWQAWSAAQDADTPDCHQTHAGGRETASAPVPVPGDPRLAAVLASVDDYWARTKAERERKRTRPPQSTYEEITCEPVEVAVARAVAEMQAAKSAA